MSDQLHERGRAMEDLYFQQKDQQLLEKLKKELAAEEGRKHLEKATGIHDQVVLDKLLDCGVNPETILAVGMIPLVLVAWADGSLDSQEKNAILEAAKETGIDEQSTSFTLLAKWMESKPGDGLFEAWHGYIGALKERLEGPVLNVLKSQILHRANEVAEKSGGFLGILNRVSTSESDMIQRLEQAF